MSHQNSKKPNSSGLAFNTAHQTSRLYRATFLQPRQLRCVHTTPIPLPWLLQMPQGPVTSCLGEGQSINGICKLGRTANLSPPSTPPCLLSQKELLNQLTLERISSNLRQRVRQRDRDSETDSKVQRQQGKASENVRQRDSETETARNRDSKTMRQRDIRTARQRCRKTVRQTARQR